MTHLILNGADLDLWPRHHSGGHVIPPGNRPMVLQRNRELAERECLRLARLHGSGLFVLFAPVALARRVPEATHVNLRGEVVNTRQVARLITISGGPEDHDVPF